MNGVVMNSVRARAARCSDTRLLAIAWTTAHRALGRKEIGYLREATTYANLGIDAVLRFGADGNVRD